MFFKDEAMSQCALSRSVCLKLVENCLGFKGLGFRARAP